MRTERKARISFFNGTLALASAAGLVTTVAIAMCSPAVRAQSKPVPAARQTPLGTQVPFLPADYTRPSSTLIPPPDKGPVVPLAEILARAATVHNAALLPQRLEWRAEGIITVRTSEGHESEYPITVLHKDTNRVLRIIKYPAGEVREGTDGTSTWGGHLFGGPASGAAARFIESQTVRSVNSLFTSSATSVRDAGMKGNVRAVEVGDAQGRKTTYFLDPVGGLVARSEVVIGETQHMISGERSSDIETYAYSDYRSVDGVLTPFRIEVQHSGFRVQTIRFETVRYNTGVRDDAFRP